MKLAEAIAKRTRDLLNQKSMSQYRLAKNMAIAPTAMRRIMNAKHAVNTKTLFLICYGLNVSILEFFDDKTFLDKENLIID